MVQPLLSLAIQLFAMRLQMCVCGGLLHSKIVVTSLINGSKLQTYIYIYKGFPNCCCSVAPPRLTHSIISVKQTSKLRLCPIWKCCCRAKTQLWCITNSHIWTLSKLAVWHIRISQTGNYSIPSSYSHQICMSCLLLTHSLP